MALESIHAIIGRYRNNIPILPALAPDVQPYSLQRDLCVSDMNHTFENFKVLPGTEKAADAFVKFAESQTPKFMLLCCGFAGTGKTFLAEALCLRLTERGLFTRYYTWSRMVSTWKQCMKPHAELDFETIFGNFANAARLVIDDLGAGTAGTDWEMAQFEDLINERYRKGKLTVVCTNKDFKELPQRVQSRFSDREYAEYVVNAGKDYRLMKGEANA